MFNDEMVTNSLIQYIQAIQRGRRTGLLIIQRTSGNTREEGRVRFQEGHVTETKLGSRTGTAAFNELCTWGRCQISFVSNDGKGMQIPIAPPPKPPASSAPSAPLAPSPTPPPGQDGPYTPGSSPLRRRSGALPENTKEQVSPQEARPSNTISLQSRPIQTRQFNAALQILETMQLSRAHRQLFLLVNGQRSVEDLITLSARSRDDVFQLLRDLERAAVIRI